MLGPATVFAAETTPLGIYAVKIAGTAPGETRARTYLGIQLLQPANFGGLVVQTDGKRFTFNGASELPLHSDADKEYYVHAINGPGAGFIARIEAYEGAWVRCDQDLGAWLPPGTQFSIRPNPRLTDLFGADNRFGFVSGENAAQSDKVVLWDSREQEERIYYFNSTRSRWEEKGIEADAGNTPIRYPNGLYIVRHSATPLRIALKGEISADPVLLPVRDGANVFSLPVNLSASLANLVSSSGPFAVKSGKNAAQSDILSFEDPAGVAGSGPFYYRSRSNDTGWRAVGTNDSDAPLQPLDMLSTLVLRHEGEDAFVRVNADLTAPPGGPFVPPADPDPGELPLEVEVPNPVNPSPAELTIVLETSKDLATWSPVSFTPRADHRVFFQLPPAKAVPSTGSVSNCSEQRPASS
ncbi:hypothetical protein [Luteolibacter sp. Populi]|uniref:hypothetical protein n=1 Tax=Luteolibacter sp. Populi TaxID=3230487 RepID=UPI003467184D